MYWMACFLSKGHYIIYEVQWLKSYRYHWTTMSITWSLASYSERTPLMYPCHCCSPEPSADIFDLRHPWWVRKTPPPPPPPRAIIRHLRPFDCEVHVLWSSSMFWLHDACPTFTTGDRAENFYCALFIQINETSRNTPEHSTMPWVHGSMTAHLVHHRVLVTPVPNSTASSAAVTCKKLHNCAFGISLCT